MGGNSLAASHVVPRRDHFLPLPTDGADGCLQKWRKSTSRFLSVYVEYFFSSYAHFVTRCCEILFIMPHSVETVLGLLFGFYTCSFVFLSNFEHPLNLQASWLVPGFWVNEQHLLSSSRVCVQDLSIRLTLQCTQVAHLKQWFGILENTIIRFPRRVRWEGWYYIRDLLSILSSDSKEENK